MPHVCVSWCQMSSSSVLLACSVKQRDAEWCWCEGCMHHGRHHFLTIRTICKNRRRRCSNYVVNTKHKTQSTKHRYRQMLRKRTRDSYAGIHIKTQKSSACLAMQPCHSTAPSVHVALTLRMVPVGEEVCHQQKSLHSQQKCTRAALGLFRIQQ